jgi:hypothetical protein
MGATMGFWDDERGCLESAQPALRSHPRARQFWRWLTQPSATDVCGVLLFGMGLIRVIDGRLFVTPQLDYAPSWLWGGLEVIMGLVILGTRSCHFRGNKRGRLVASIACGYCVALAVAIFPTSANAAYVHLIIAYVMALEAQVVNECQ